MSEHTPPPRENLIRAVMPAVEYRDAPSEGDAGPVLFGHFARFNEWTEIRSAWEGNFMERFVPGAFRKTLRERGNSLKVLFQHGHDPEVGDKPIAAINDVREDDQGAFYEARLFDGLPPLVMDGLRAGQYGASFRFSVVREEINEDPGASEHNPLGLPERTVKESKVAEFGPVTFPAYGGASAGVRSMTDEFLMDAIRMDPVKAREMFDRALSLKDITPDKCECPVAPEVVEGHEVSCRFYRNTPKDAPAESDAEATEPHLTDARRETTPPTRRPIYGKRRKEQPKWLLGPSKSTKRT
jgi:HK97 family phage prohead protease